MGWNLKAPCQFVPSQDPCRDDDRIGLEFVDGPRCGWSTDPYE
jgi:hypothetical protein